MESILIGKISSIHGIKGEVKIYPYTDDVENLTTLKEIYMDENLNLKHIITNLRVHKNMLIAKFADINDVDEAEKFKDKDLYIPKSFLKDLEEDSYYILDLIGMQVLNSNEELFGTLTYVFNTGANDVYEVKDKDNKCFYLPAIKDVIKKIDIKNKKMYVEVMEGLL